MKPKISDATVSAGSVLSRNRSQQSSELIRRQLSKLVADKLNVGKGSHISSTAVSKISSASMPTSQLRNSRVTSHAKIIVREPTKSFENNRHERSESLKVLIQPTGYAKIYQQPSQQPSNSQLQRPPSLTKLSEPNNSIQQLLKRFAIDESRVSNKACGIIKAYGANTHKGIVRNYNEDRVSIVTNFGRERNMIYLAVYDGHGGSACVDYLKDNLHSHLSEQLNQTKDIREALTKAIYLAEYNVLKNSELQKDCSGSCALVALVHGIRWVNVDNIVHLANVGDCRAIVSERRGNRVIQLTSDHKPSQPSEQERIVRAGGMIYQNRPTTVGGVNPCRVHPGRLSVSRTIGDLEAKVEKYGGKKNVVVAQPDIYEYRVTEDTDFLLLASDGVFDELTNQQIVAFAHQGATLASNVHLSLGKCIQTLMAHVFLRQVTDNVSIVMISFNNFCSLGQEAQRNSPQPAEQRSPSAKKPSPKRDLLASNLASYKRLQTVKEVLKRSVSSKK